MLEFVNKKFDNVSEVFRYLEETLNWIFERISAKKDGGAEWTIYYDGKPTIYKFKEVA